MDRSRHTHHQAASCAKRTLDDPFRIEPAQDVADNVEKIAKQTIRHESRLPPGARHQPGPRVTPNSLAYVEPWPSGGWAVKLVHHPTPVSRHDTEDEARDKAAAYQRGLENEEQEAQPATPSR